MPVVIVLDVSLSMLRPASSENGGTEDYQRKNLAIHGINTLLDQLAAHSKLEFVALIVFSSLFEVLSNFTRDFDSIRAKLAVIEDRDKTCLEAALHGASKLILEEWGQTVLCQIILVTDGSYGTNMAKFSRLLANPRELVHSSEPLPLPFSFPAKFHTVLLANPDESSLSLSIPLYQKLIEFSGVEGAVHVPEGTLSMKSVQNLFLKIAEKNFASFQGTLRCGKLSDAVSLFPPPQNYYKLGEFEVIRGTLSNEIYVCGFINLADVSSPPSISRHLVLPNSIHKTENSIPDAKNEMDVDEDVNSADEGKYPSFCVLLHGALKIENMGAICCVGENWYGLLYSWADSKKKSNLMLSIFEPGSKCIPWLGDLSNLGPVSEASVVLAESTFPVKPLEKRSYAQSCVVWVQPGGLQADLQKLLRHARKMPEKTQHFYKELNRIRRAALSLGFVELLDTLASVLERECTLLPPSAHSDCALQLSHAAAILRQPQSRDLRQNIVGLRTKFSHDD